MIADFAPFPALLGGALIGLAATLLLWTTGRIAGVSGIAAGAITAPGPDRDWRTAFLVTGLGPSVMVVVCLAMPAVTPARSERRLLDFGPVIRNRPAMGYVLGYGAHCFELYGIRTWIVAFWTFARKLRA